MLTPTESRGLDPATLVRDGRLVAAAIDAAAPEANDLVAAFAANPEPALRAALALIAGTRRVQAAMPALVALLGDDGLAGRAAGWALAQLDAERETLAAITDGGLDARDNAYYSLAVRAANGAHSPALAPAMAERVRIEIDRAKAKLTGLGEKASRVLAILGDKRTGDLIQQVSDNDPYTDRFELQRLRKAVNDGGRDTESISELSAPWSAQFADHLYQEPKAPVAAPSAAPTAPAKAGPPPAKPAAGAPPVAPVADAGLDAEALDAEGGEGLPPAPAIDWPAFAASPEANALPATSKGLVMQLGPLLDQLAVRAINAPLSDLSGQEFAALLLQVLPQALPPQHVQAALSPPAITGYQGLAKYLARTGLATHGDDLLKAVKAVRQQLIAQIKQAGILGGPDYSDPDDAAPPVAPA